MIEHRAAVSERLVDQEAEGLRQLNLGRDQILARLWELANLSHEVTRGIIAGQIKALAMIVAIEGLNPDRRLSSSAGTQPAAPPVKAQIYNSEWRREQQHQPVGEEPRDPAAAAKTPPAAPQVPEPEPIPEPAPKLANDTSSPNLDRNQPSLANPFINPERLNRVPAATDYVFDAVLDKASSLRLSFSPDKRFSGRPVEVDKKPNFIEFYEISRSLDSSGAASAGRKMALHHRQRDRGQYSFGVGKTMQRKSKANTPRYTQSVSSMHW
jgi:hypothetical protein